MGEKINFEELRAKMPKKLNKLGEWQLVLTLSSIANNHNSL